jgi:hypothetical protein
MLRNGYEPVCLKRFQLSRYCFYKLAFARINVQLSQQFIAIHYTSPLQDLDDLTVVLPHTLKSFFHKSFGSVPSELLLLPLDHYPLPLVIFPELLHFVPQHAHLLGQLAARLVDRIVLLLERVLDVLDDELGDGSAVLLRALFPVFSHLMRREINVNGALFNGIRLLPKIAFFLSPNTPL